MQGPGGTRRTRPTSPGSPVLVQQHHKGGHDAHYQEERYGQHKGPKVEHDSTQLGKRQAQPCNEERGTRPGCERHSSSAARILAWGLGRIVGLGGGSSGVARHHGLLWGLACGQSQGSNGLYARCQRRGG